MSMHIPDKQGYLGNLETKSTEELKYLLQRQTTLLQNRNFIGQLPDKGKKITELVNRLNKILSEKDSADNTAALFQKMALEAETKRAGRGQADDDGTADSENISSTQREDEAISVLEKMAVRGEEVKQVEELRNETNKSYVNNYAKAISKSEDMKKAEQKFVPSKSIKAKCVADVVEKPSKPKTTESTRMDTGSCRKPKYDECLMHPGHSTTNKVKAVLISVEESVTLQQEQQKKVLEMQTKHAAERLAEKLNVKMAPFNPEGSAFTRYREPGLGTEDSDADDNPDGLEQDYPD